MSHDEQFQDRDDGQLSFHTNTSDDSHDLENADPEDIRDKCATMCIALGRPDLGLIVESYTQAGVRMGFTKTNQDSHFMDHVTIEETGDYVIKFGVFDGHGDHGEYVSRFLKLEMLRYFHYQEGPSKMRDFYLVDIRCGIVLKKMVLVSGCTGTLASFNVTQNRIRVW